MQQTSPKPRSSERSPCRCNGTKASPAAYPASLWWSVIDDLAATAGLSLADLADASELESSCLLKHKRRYLARLRWPNLKTIAKICTALNIDANDLAILLEAKRTTTRLRDAPPRPARW